MAEPETKRPAILRYLALELVLLTLAGSIYWYKVTHPDAAEPVPVMPIAVSDQTSGVGAPSEAPHPATPSGASIAQSDRSALAVQSKNASFPRTAVRSLPVRWDSGPQGRGLVLRPLVAQLTPKDHGATLRLEAVVENHVANAEVRHLRLVLECLSLDGERIGVDSFEALGPQQPPLKPLGHHAFTLTSNIDPRTASIRLLVHVRDEVPAGT